MDNKPVFKFDPKIATFTEIRTEKVATHWITCWDSEDHLGRLMAQCTPSRDNILTGIPVEEDSVFAPKREEVLVENVK